MECTYQPSDLVRERRHGFRARWRRSPAGGLGSAPAEGPRASLGLTARSGSASNLVGRKLETLKVRAEFLRVAGAGPRSAGAGLVVKPHRAARSQATPPGYGRDHREPKNRQRRRPQPRKAADARGSGKRPAVAWTTRNRLCVIAGRARLIGLCGTRRRSRSGLRRIGRAGAQRTSAPASKPKS